MLNNVISALEEQFKKDCTVIDLKYEYEGYIGTERYIIVSHLSEQEILEMYPAQAHKYSPFVKVEVSFMSARQNYIQNEDKYRKRARRTQDIFDFDERMAVFHKELMIGDFVLEKEEEDRNREITATLYKALSTLTEKQKKRVMKYYVNNRTLREIAKEEGVKFQTVEESIETSIKKLKNFFKTP